MSDPLLAQIPLTISPFVSFPRPATTLPYTWKALPSTLPPSSTGDDSKAKYVISQSGHAAHPDEIIASCQALRAHLKKMQDDAEQSLKKWQDEIAERELAEKRKIAPGWLDRDEKILQPVKKCTAQSSAQESLMDLQEDGMPVERSLTQQRYDEGEEMDRAFGDMMLK